MVGKSFESDPKWHTFIAEADAHWQELELEEQRLRDEVLPTKQLPFSTSVTCAEIVVESDVEMQTRDGTVLRADIFRPKAKDRYPVILIRSPYDKRSSLDYAPSVMRNLAQRGYVTIIQDVRGKFSSDGEFTPRQNELCDGYDAVEWAAAQDWSNGKVGMWGISYGGFSSLTAAASRPPHLSCIYPGMIDIHFLPKIYTSMVGLQGRAGWLLWAGLGREGGNPLRLDYEHLPLQEIDEKAGYPNPLFDALVTMDLKMLTDAAAGAGDEAMLSLIDTSVLMVAGWYDEFVIGTLNTWTALQRTNPRARLIIGPWHHNLMSMEDAKIGSLPTEKVESSRYFELMEAFFATHLKSGKTSVTDDPPVKLFVMGKNYWRDEREWPLQRAVKTPYYLHSSGGAGTAEGDGRLDLSAPDSEEPRDEYDYDPLNPVAWPPSTDVWEYLNSMEGCAAIESREDVLVYTSVPLTQELEVTGPITMILFASTDAEDTDFLGTVIDVHPNGHSQYLTSGIVRARYRDGFDQPTLIEPNRVYKYEIEVAPTSNVFLEGHSLRVVISSSDFPRYSRNQNTPDPVGSSSRVCTAHQKILHNATYPSHIILPIVSN